MSVDRTIPLDDTALLTGRDIVRRLSEFGFTVRGRCADSQHLLIGLGSSQFVVPGLDRQVPCRVERILDAALQPMIGPARLRPAAPTADGTIIDGTDDVVTLDVAVLEPDVADEPWLSFLVDEPAVTGFGATRDDALRDLKAAAALQLGRPVEQLALVTPSVF